MKKEELLAMGIAGENAEKILSEFSKTVPYSRFQEIVEEKNTYKNLLNERDTQLKNLQKENKDNEELSKQIKELQSANELASKEYESKLANMKLETEIKLALTESGARDSQLLLGLVDKTKVKFENEKLIGLEEQIKTLKQDRDYLFNVPKETEIIVPKGATPTIANTQNTPQQNQNGIMSFEQFLNTKNY